MLALFRLANPSGELRMAAGREVHLGPLQPLGLFAANSMFVGGYLTEPGGPPEDDYRMIEALGFTSGSRQRRAVSTDTGVLSHRPLTPDGGYGIITGLAQRAR